MMMSLIASLREHFAAWKIPAACIFIVTVTFICFLPALGNDLLMWDDAGYILDNPHIRSLNATTIRWAFTEFYCNYWAPLMWLSLSLDYAVWGVNPLGYHLTNNLLHAFNAGMFFFLSLWLCRCYLESRNNSIERGIQETNAPLIALIAALVFGIHPLRVESVAWAAERKDVLSLFFGLPAFLAYLHHVRSLKGRQGCNSIPSAGFMSNSPWYWLTLVFFVLSLLSKSMLVTFPLVLLLLDWFPLGRLKTVGFGTVVTEKIPLFICSAMAAIFTMLSQKPSYISIDHANMASRFLNAFKTIIS